MSRHVFVGCSHSKQIRRKSWETFSPSNVKLLPQFELLEEICSPLVFLQRNRDQNAGIKTANTRAKITQKSHTLAVPFQGLFIWPVWFNNTFVEVELQLPGSNDPF